MTCSSGLGPSFVDLAAARNKVIRAENPDRPAIVAKQIATIDQIGHGRAGLNSVGTPDQVAEGILKLHAARFAGTTLSFVDYVAEFPYFRDTVLPKLAAAGIR